MTATEYNVLREKVHIYLVIMDDPPWPLLAIVWTYVPFRIAKSVNSMLVSWQGWFCLASSQ